MVWNGADLPVSLENVPGKGRSSVAGLVTALWTRRYAPAPGCRSFDPAGLEFCFNRPHDRLGSPLPTHPGFIILFFQAKVVIYGR
jgi:hypothetical protein